MAGEESGEIGGAAEVFITLVAAKHEVEELPFERARQTLGGLQLGAMLAVLRGVPIAAAVEANDEINAIGMARESTIWHLRLREALRGTNNEAAQAALLALGSLANRAMAARGLHDQADSSLEDAAAALQTAIEKLAEAGEAAAAAEDEYTEAVAAQVMFSNSIQTYLGEIGIQ